MQTTMLQPPGSDKLLFQLIQHSYEQDYLSPAPGGLLIPIMRRLPAKQFLPEVWKTVTCFGLDTRAVQSVQRNHGLR